MLILEKTEGVGVVTLNRPEKLNALCSALIEELGQAVTHLENDDEVKAIIVTGAGGRSFSVGADIHEMVQKSAEQLRERKRIASKLAACRKPIIGAINGLAYGGGALLSTVCDIRLGCERTSFRFMGVVYRQVNSTWTLPSIVGWPMARELLLTGRVVKADEALRIGLVNRLVPASDLMKEAMEVGQSIAVHDATTVQTIKEILGTNMGKSWQEMLLNETETVSRCLKEGPRRELFKGFLERKTI